MSRLINDEISELNQDNKRDGDDRRVRHIPLSPEKSLEHLKSCQTIAVKHARGYFGVFAKALSHAFDLQIDAARSNQEVAELSGIQRLFQKNRQEIEEYFAGYVAEGFVKFKQKTLCTELNQSGGEELSIVDNLDLEESLLLAGIVQSIENDLAEPLWALNQRMALLNGGEPVREASNPSAPVQFCESIRKACKLIPMTIPAAKTVLSTFGDNVRPLIQDVVSDTNQYLAEKGVMPDLKYRKSKPVIAKKNVLEKEAEALADNGDGDSATYQQSLLGAIRGLQQTLSSLSQQPNVLNSSMGAFSNQQLVDALQAVQLQSLGMMAMPFGGGASAISPMNINAIQQQLQQQLGAQGHVGQNDMYAIDLVGRIFEYMLRDDNLPDSVKAALSYLHTPFIKVAFLDRGFFENPDHPARALLNDLAEAGVHWIGNDGTIQHDMLNKIRHTVDRVLKEFTNDLKVITSILIEFNNYTKNIVRRQDLMEKRATEKAQGEVRLREVKNRVNEEIMKRTEERDLPSSVLLFLLQPWFDFLSFCMLRYGIESEQWLNALGLVDDLLWAIEHKTESSDRTIQQELITRLQVEIKAGFDVIGYDADKGEKLIESITDVLRASLAQQTLAPEPEPVRIEAAKVVAEKKIDNPASLSNKATDEEQRVIDGLKLIEFGTWFEFDGGRRLKVAWYNSRTMHYMLVNQVGKKEAMLTGLELARKMIAKTAVIVSGSSKPFFERALENIYQNMASSDTAKGDIEHI